MMSLFDLSGRIGLVTGGGTGIGRDIAAALADAGATLIIAGRRQDVAANAAADLSRAQAMALDVTDRAAIDRTVASIVTSLSTAGWTFSLPGLALTAACRRWNTTRQAGMR